MFNEESKKFLIKNVTVFLVAVFLLAFGFYFGYKFKSSENLVVKAQQGVEETNNPALSKIQNSAKTPVNTEPVPEIFIPQRQDQGACPNSHPVKAKFDSQTRKFYTKDNRFYSRVKANLCFANPEDALKYEFIQQF